MRHTHGTSPAQVRMDERGRLSLWCNDERVPGVTSITIGGVGRDPAEITVKFTGHVVPIRHVTESMG